MAERGAMSSAKGNTTDDDRYPTGTKQHSPRQSSAKSSGKCPHSYFLMCALTAGQVAVLLLFLLWTIKACFIRYHRVYIVTTVDSSAFDPRNQSIRNALHHSNITEHHHDLHGNRSNIAVHLGNGTQLEHAEWNVAMNNKSAPKSNMKRKIRIVCTTNSESLSFTLNWLESMKRLNLNIDVTFIVEDESAYKILSRKKKNSKKFDRTRLIAGKRSKGARIAGLSSSDSDVILGVLESGTDVVHIAADTVWLKDPLPHLWQRYDKCDLWITFGAIKTQSLSLAYMKASPNVIAYVKALQEQMKSSTDTVLTHFKALKLGIAVLRYNVRLCYLGDDHFPTEKHVFEDHAWYNAHKEGIFVVRTGAIVDTAQKRHLLQMKNLWYLRNSTGNV